MVGLATLTVGVIAMPASVLQRWLPPTVQAQDFSGSVWHGSAGRVIVNSRDAGAIEWHLHPWPLLTLRVSADLHWVKIGFVADGSVEVDRHGATVRNLVGGGPLESLNEFGLKAGWRGLSQFEFSEVRISFEASPGFTDVPSLRSAVGEFRVANLSSPQIAGGADLGGYALHVANGAITADAEATADLVDTGGPLRVKATIQFSAKTHTGLLSGTIEERPDASAALRRELENLTQLHARDTAGRIPVELEFTL
jgi:hypothetical protein